MDHWIYWWLIRFLDAFQLTTVSLFYHYFLILKVFRLFIWLKSPTIFFHYRIDKKLNLSKFDPSKASDPSLNFLLPDCKNLLPDLYLWVFCKIKLFIINFRSDYLVLQFLTVNQNILLTLDDRWHFQKNRVIKVPIFSQL